MKLRLALATAAFGVAAVLGLTACQHGLAGTSAGASAADSGITTLSPEETALTLLGYDEQDVITDVPADSPSAAASGGPAASASAGKNGAGHRRIKRLAVRRALARNVEHGEVVIDTKDGTKTVDIQRGTVTAITDTTITVKSTDGFTLTWTFGNPLHVIEHRSTIQAKDIAVGAKVGVAGAKVGDTVTATLVVIPNNN
jgi:hypothetical protein